MILKRVLQLLIILPFVFLCVLPIAFLGFIIGEPAIRGWLTERSIIVIEGATYTFSNDMQFSGSYKQRNLYYWSPKQLPEIKQFYQDFTLKPFAEVNSHAERWFIAAWKGSKINENPIGKGLSSDLCDYNNAFGCISIALFDTEQWSLSEILGSIYNTPMNEIQSLAHSGTLIVFSYFIPDYS